MAAASRTSATSFPVSSTPTLTPASPSTASFPCGLDVARWTAVMRLGDSDGDDKDQKDREGRALNAFDIISLTPGCDLFGLFGAGRQRDWFVWAEPVLDRAEQVARAERWRARRLGKKRLGGVPRMYVPPSCQTSSDRDGRGRWKGKRMKKGKSVILYY